MALSKNPANPFYSDGPRGWQTTKWATPFSGLRWQCPELCNFEGRCLYLDSDLIVMADIAELWNTEIEPGKCVVARDARRFCVSLWNCAAAKPHVLAPDALKRADGHQRQSAYFCTHGELVRPFDGLWNYLDSQDTAPLAQAKIVHYTDLSTQPSMRHAVPRLAAESRKHWYDGPRRRHPRQDIVQRFELEYAHAREAGYTVERYIPAETFGDVRKRSMVGYRSAAGARVDIPGYGTAPMP